jgi:hypothetical protein
MMIKGIAIVAMAAGICTAVPAFAEEVGVGVGPVGVTVGSAPPHERDRTTVIKEREPRDKTVIIRKDHDMDRPHDKVIVDHD